MVERMAKEFFSQQFPPKNCGEFLRVAENKKEMFAFLSREVFTSSTEKQIVSTLLKDILFWQSRSKGRLAHCSHEEADTLDNGSCSRCSQGIQYGQLIGLGYLCTCTVSNIIDCSVDGFFGQEKNIGLFLHTTFILHLVRRNL